MRWPICKTSSTGLGPAMKDQLALLLCGVIVSLLAWASWRWWGDDISFAVLVIVLLGLAVDNFRLRRQVRALLTERQRA